MTLSVLIVIVNYRRSEDTKACIDSLTQLEVGQIDLTIAVCDNGSTEGSGAAVIEYLDEAPVAFDCQEANTKAFLGRTGPYRCYVVLSSKNHGFAGGNNLAYRVACQDDKYDYIWFLNNDTEVMPDSLFHMIEHMESNVDIGICGSTLIYSWNRNLVQCFGGCMINFWTGSMHQIGHGLTWPCDIDQIDVERRMDYPSGASMLVNNRFLSVVGLMSEDYFIFYEEIDWSIRARRAGFRLGYASRSIVYHKEGASIGTGTGAKRSALAEYYGVRNKLLFTRRFFPMALPSVWLISWLQVIRRLTQQRWRQAGLIALTLCGLGSTPQH